MLGSRAAMLAVALIASLVGGGSAAAIAPETSITPVMELPSGCGGDDWSFDSSID